MIQGVCGLCAVLFVKCFLKNIARLGDHTFAQQLERVITVVVVKQSAVKTGAVSAVQLLTLVHFELNTFYLSVHE